MIDSCGLYEVFLNLDNGDTPTTMVVAPTRRQAELIAMEENPEARSAVAIWVRAILSQRDRSVPS